MAHFAELDGEGVVLNVITVNNETLEHKEFPESEALGVAFCAGLFGGVWKQTSYTGAFRKNFAMIGGKYDADLDAFVAPKHFPSWILNTDTAQWESPLPLPEDGHFKWDEDIQNWVQLEWPEGYGGEPEYEVE